MDYWAGLDITMDETHVCVLDREGEVVRESKTVSTARAIADELGSLLRVSTLSGACVLCVLVRHLMG